LCRQHRREFRVGNNLHFENGLAALDFVAVGEHRILNLRAIQKSPVAALAILHAAAARSALHGKVHARHKRVVRQSKLRPPRRPSDRDGLAGLQPDDLPRHRPFSYFQYYSHSLFSLSACSDSADSSQS